MRSCSGGGNMVKRWGSDSAVVGVAIYKQGNWKVISVFCLVNQSLKRSKFN